MDPHTPELKEYMRKMPLVGIVPKVIYDFGACHGYWTELAKKTWPDATIVCFDALMELNTRLDYVGVLGDVDGKEVEFWCDPEDAPWAGSYYKELNSPNLKPKLMTMRTIDSVVKQYGFPPPDFIRLDVQGCELDILKGGSETFRNTSTILVELAPKEHNQGSPEFIATVKYLEKEGFTCIGSMISNNILGYDWCFMRLGEVKSIFAPQTE